MSPTQLSLRMLRADGWTAEVVEQNVPHARTKRDLFGFVDIVAIRGTATLAVQTTSASNVNARLNKIAASPHVVAVTDAGWRLVVHGWRPDGRLREVVVLEGAARG